MTVVVMVQSGPLFESKIVITRDGKDIYGFDVFFHVFGEIVTVQGVSSGGDAFFVGVEATVWTVIIVQNCYHWGWQRYLWI